MILSSCDIRKVEHKNNDKIMIKWLCDLEFILQLMHFTNIYYVGPLDTMDKVWRSQKVLCAGFSSIHRVMHFKPHDLSHIAQGVNFSERCRQETFLMKYCVANHLRRLLWNLLHFENVGRRCIDLIFWWKKISTLWFTFPFYDFNW